MTEAALFSITNVLIGFIVSWLITMIVLPLFDLYPSKKQAFGITAVFTIAAMLRNFVVYYWWSYAYV